MKLVFLSFLLFALTKGCDKRNLVTPDTIIHQLPAGKNWSVKQVNNPDFYKYKISRDSGYAAISVSLLREVLFCNYNFKDYETATDLTRLVSFRELKVQFEQCEGTDKRAVPVLNSVRDTTLGGIPALLFISNYHNISPDIIGGIEYYVIRANQGWILINTSFIRKDEHVYRNEFNDKLNGIKLKP